MREATPRPEKPATVGGVVCKATGLVGTLLSGVLYLWGGPDFALWGSAAFVAITWLLTLRLPPLPENVSVLLASIESGD